MYKYLESISERAYRSARERGKDVSFEGCIKALESEVTEFWDAVENGGEWDGDKIEAASLLLADDDLSHFTRFYEENIHNTVMDELSDIIIIAGTIYGSEKEQKGIDFDPHRSVRIMVADGIYGQATELFEIAPLHQSLENASQLFNAVALKQRFNELRDTQIENPDVV